jgi:hypothetical protein
MGGKWLHLRICLTCGHVACWDNSPNRHAAAHAHATSHPIIRSREPGEDWSWCYVDEVAFLVDGISAGLSRASEQILVTGPATCRTGCATADNDRSDSSEKLPGSPHAPSRRNRDGTSERVSRSRRSTRQPRYAAVA